MTRAVPDPSRTGVPALGRRTLVAGGALSALTMAGARADAAQDRRDPRPHHPHHHRHHDQDQHHDQHRRLSRPSTRLTITSTGLLQRGGADFRTGGVNAFQLITDDYAGPRLTTHGEIDSLLTKAVLLNASVVRAHTLGASVGRPCTLVTGVSGSGPNPTIGYDPAVWELIDYAVFRAHQLGLYLIAPLVDEWGYYHGGKRDWVAFRRPGTVSLDPSVTTANSSTQRAAERAFYTDPQVGWDFEQYIRDWLSHVNRYTGVAFKDEPALSIVQIGNELWTAPQDAPGWVAAKAALIKSVSPGTLVMDSGADGLPVESMAWASPDVDILETHVYRTFAAPDVRRMAAFAADHGKSFAVGEYAWSTPGAPDVEAAVRSSANAFTSAPWSLQNDADLHNAGAAYGSDDVSLYVPGKDPTQRAAVARLTAHGRALATGRAPTSRRRRHRRDRPHRRR